MKLASKMYRLGTESAFKVLAQAQALEAKGMSVVHLEIGEPDFDTPPNIRDAAAKAMNSGFTHYSNSQGIIPLRKEIANQFEKRFSYAVEPDRIIVTPGAKPIMFYAIIALLEEGDEAIYPDPGFPIYESMINFTGAKAVPAPLREDLEFRLDVRELETLITPRTRLIILNSPHNPTGSVLSESDVRRIAELAKKNNIVVFSDEVYDQICYDEKPMSFASVPGMLDQTILLNGFSKTYAMTGWRLGYAVVPRELVDPINKLIVNSVSCTPTFIQYAGIEALTGPQDSVPVMVEEFRKRRDMFVNGLNEIYGISCVMPKGAFYVFPNIKKLGMTSDQVFDYFLNDAGVAALSGTAFGKYGEGYLRMSYATSQANLKKALERISDAVTKLGK